jgi:small subunit ribosomal protein S17
MKVFLQIYNLYFLLQILTMAAVLKNSILLGQVLPSTLKTAVKVQVPYFVFDKNLKAYFKKTETFVAEDMVTGCKTGDLVLIQKLAKQDKKEITHSVAELVTRLGDVKDPISGEMVVGPDYRKEMLEEAKLYGADKENFNYKDSPARGRLEGTRDFTDKPTYRKWHNFEKDDPYGVLN